MIYLDYSANTPVDPDVLEAFCRAEREYIGNPNSQHLAGNEAAEAMEKTDEGISKLLHADGYEIIYTSGASESNNLAIKGITHGKTSQSGSGQISSGQISSGQIGSGQISNGVINSGQISIRQIKEEGTAVYRGHIISTVLEHESVRESLIFLKNEGYDVDFLNVQSDGKINLEQLRSLMRDDTILVSICAVDSELGVMQPIQQIAEIVHEYPDCVLHVDATQAVGKIDLMQFENGKKCSCGDDTTYVDDSNKKHPYIGSENSADSYLCGADTISISPHKFYGITGSGLLLKRRNLKIEPQISGGASTTPYRSGTPALALAVSTETALRKVITNQRENTARVKMLNDELRRSVTRSQYDIRINSPADAVPHILNISVDGVKGTAFQRALSDKGVCVSVKSACSSDGEPSRAVLAVSGDRRNALSSFRISLSHLTTDEEIKEFMDIFDKCYHEFKD